MIKKVAFHPCIIAVYIGGEKDNAIAKFSEASVAVLPEEVEEAKQIIENTFAQIKEEYKVTDPGARLTVNVKETADVETFTEDTTFAVVTAMVHMPDGVQRMNPEIEGLVQTSLNMGILTTKDSEVQMTFAVRSSSETEKQYLIAQLTSLSETLGGEIRHTLHTALYHRLPFRQLQNRQGC